MGDVKNADCMDKRINREGKAVVDYKPTWCTFQSELGIQKKSTPKKIIIFSQKRFSYILWNDFLAIKLKKFFILASPASKFFP